MGEDREWGQRERHTYSNKHDWNLTNHVCLITWNNYSTVIILIIILYIIKAIHLYIIYNIH